MTCADGALPDTARRFLRAFSNADLLIDGQRLHARWTCRPRDGALTLCLPDLRWPERHAVLVVPDESAPTLELLLEGDPSHADHPDVAPEADRWEAYHGRPRDTVWILARIEGARWHREILDDIATVVPVNTLGAGEAPLRRELNATPDDLARALRARGRHAEGRPVAVGVDQDGVDVRLGGVVSRLEFPATATDPDDARAALRELLRADAGS